MPESDEFWGDPPMVHVTLRGLFRFFLIFVMDLIEHFGFGASQFGLLCGAALLVFFSSEKTTSHSRKCILFGQ